MFCITPTNKIVLTQGDNAELDLRVYNNEGSEVEILPSDTITLTVKKAGAEIASLEKTAELNSIFIEPEDTKSMELGMYNYQIDFVRDGEVQTIIPCSLFELREELR